MKESDITGMQEMHIIDELIDIGFIDDSPLKTYIEPDLEGASLVEMDLINLIFVYLFALKNNIIKSGNEVLNDYIALSFIKLEYRSRFNDLKKYTQIFKDSLPKHWREFDDVLSAKREGKNLYPDYYYYRIINNPLSIYDPVVPELSILELYDEKELSRLYYELIRYIEVVVRMEMEELLNK